MVVEISNDDDDDVVDAMVNCKSGRRDGDPDDDDGVVDAMVNCKSSRLSVCTCCGLSKWLLVC